MVFRGEVGAGLLVDLLKLQYVAFAVADHLVECGGVLINDDIKPIFELHAVFATACKQFCDVIELIAGKCEVLSELLEGVFRTWPSDRGLAVDKPLGVDLFNVKCVTVVAYSQVGLLYDLGEGF